MARAAAGHGRHPRAHLRPLRPLSARGRAQVPAAAFFTPHAEKSLSLLAEKGIAGFRTPEACADAFRAFFDWRAPRAEPGGAEPSWPAGVPSTGALTERDALKVFASLGVPTVASAVATAPGYAHSVPYPVAAKVLSPDIAHKTEAGGVELRIPDASAFASRVEAMLARVKASSPGARIEGVLVQAMESGLAEAIVGYRDDPLVGPTVLVGAGGTLAEIYRDTQLRLAPVTEDEAAEMIARVKGFAVLRGFRGMPKGDLAALARVVAAVSRLARLPGRPVSEAEINPLIVKSGGVVAVDGLMVLHQG